MKFLKSIFSVILVTTVTICQAGKVEITSDGIILLVDEEVKLAVQFNRSSSTIPSKALGMRKLIASVPGLVVKEEGSDDLVEQGRADGVVGRDILKHFDLTFRWVNNYYAFTPPKAPPSIYNLSTYKIAYLGENPHLEVDVNKTLCRMELTLLTKGVSFSGETLKKLGTIYTREEEIYGMGRKGTDGLETWFEASLDDDLPSALHGDFGVDMILEDEQTISFNRGVFETYRRTKNFSFFSIVASVTNSEVEQIGNEFWVPLTHEDGRQTRGKITHINGFDIDLLFIRYKSDGLKALKSIIENRFARNATIETSLGESGTIEIRRPGSR